MKRKLSLLLAVVMILGTFSFAFADDDFDVPAFLEKEGILKGNTKGDLMLDEPLLRKDAVVLLARLLKAEDEAEAFEKEGLPTFNDLAGNPYYNAFLAWAEDNGYFTGKPDGSFGYEDNLEAVEYALVLLRALGYVNEDKADEWEKAWDTAKKLGLLEDVKAERREEILRKEVAQMTYNALGVTMKDSDKTLAEFLGITLPEPDVLEVVEVYTENLAEVVVELSNAKLADKAKLENPANYRLSGTNDPVVTAAKVDGNNVILTLVPSGNVQEMKDEDLNKALVKGRKYDLTIRNIAREINKTYKGILAEDNAIPAVEKVEFMGDYGIKVVTTEPVKVPQERNFVVDGTRTSMFVEQYGRVIILTPYHDKAFPEDAKTLTVKGLEDFAGYKSVESDYELELSTDKDAPKVVKALRNGHKLTVEFDRDIYRKSVKGYESRRDLGNVSFQERRVTFYAEEAKKVAPNVAVYTFEREIPKNAEVTVEGVQNHFKIEMEKEVVNPDLFVDEYPPVIISKLVNDVETVGNEGKGEITLKTKALTITFDKDIQEFVEHQKKDGKQIKVEDFFTLYELNVNNKGKEAAKDVEIVIEEVKDDYIKLSFKNIRVNNKDRDYDYVLEVRDFSDLNRNRMEREYIDFQIVEASEDFKLTGINVIPTGRYETEVRLFFNAPVDKEIASDRTNYFFGDKKATAASEAIVERDGETVTLVVGKKIEDVRDYGILEVSPKVIDIDENKIASIKGESSRFWDLRTLRMINVDPVDVTSAITYIDAAGKAIDNKEAHKVDVDETTDAKEVITVKATGEAGDQYIVELINDKTNKKVQVEVLDVDATKEGTKDINVPITASAKFTIKVTGKENSELKVHVQATKTAGTVEFGETKVVLKGGKVYKADGTTEISTGAAYTVPFDTALTSLREANFTVEADEPSTVVEDLTKYVVKDADNAELHITLKAENGLTQKYTVLVKRAVIDFDATASTAVLDTTNKKLVTVTLKDELGKPVTTLGEDDFEITVTANTTSKSAVLKLDSVDGNVYTFKSDLDLTGTPTIATHATKVVELKVTTAD